MRACNLKNFFQQREKEKKLLSNTKFLQLHIISPPLLFIIVLVNYEVALIL